MRSDIRNFIKLYFVITGIEFVFFILMLCFVMTDESIGKIGKVLVLFVRYVLDFPLVLLNDEYPYFFNNNEPLSHMMLLIILNLTIHTDIILFIKTLMRKIEK